MGRGMVRYRREGVGKSYLEELKNYLVNILSTDYREYLSGKLYTTWINNIGFIHRIIESPLKTIVKATIIYSGEWIGLIKDGRAYLSPFIYQEVYSKKGFKAAIVVSDKALKNFLYGKDILASSIIEVYPPLYNPVAILDPIDKRVVGVAKPMVKYSLFKKYIASKSLKPIYENVYDLGLFLRFLD